MLQEPKSLCCTCLSSIRVSESTHKWQHFSDLITVSLLVHLIIPHLQNSNIAFIKLYFFTSACLLQQYVFKTSYCNFYDTCIKHFFRKLNENPLSCLGSDYLMDRMKDEVNIVQKVTSSLYLTVVFCLSSFKAYNDR